MKAVLIIHNAAIDGEVNEALQEVGITCYSKFKDVLGKGQLSDPHLNTEVWPGINHGTLLVVEQEKVEKIMNRIRRLRKNLGSEGIKAFTWQIDDVT